jgi:hypothetical protein
VGTPHQTAVVDDRNPADAGYLSVKDIMRVLTVSSMAAPAREPGRKEGGR